MTNKDPCILVLLLPGGKSDHIMTMNAENQERIHILFLVTVGWFGLLPRSCKPSSSATTGC